MYHELIKGSFITATLRAGLPFILHTFILVFMMADWALQPKQSSLLYLLDTATRGAD